MTPQDKVKSRYPHATAEKEGGFWLVWDISHDRRKHLDERYWPQTNARYVWGMGRTEDEAWRDAVRKIEQFEGRTLPV